MRQRKAPERRKAPELVTCPTCKGKGKVEDRSWKPAHVRTCVTCLGLGQVTNPKAIQK